MEEKRQLYIDWMLVTTVILISLFGLIMVYSASFVEGYENYNNALFYFNRHLMWLVLGLGVFFFLMFFPYRHYQKLIPFMLLGSFALLLIVLLTPLGHTVNGATRWIAIGGFTIQPSEFVKLAMIIYLASVYAKKAPYIHDFKNGLFKPLLVVAAAFILIMFQPDLGTGTSIIMVAGLLAFLAGARLWHIVSLAVLAVSVIWFYASSAEYRMNRLAGYLNAFELEQTEGFQVVQSFIAVAHGGLTGAGLGQSVQKLFYLPEAHTDFILAIVSEELGFLGVAAALLFASLLIGRGFLIGFRARDTFGSLLAFGISAQLAVQVIFNSGAVTGLLPVTGIPFPFLSYGGSSLLVTLASVGILANISRRVEKDRRLRQNDPDEEELHTESYDVNVRRSEHAGT
ncbi:putative lipid II flippase FtsW [Alkalicoccus chagannorensis]|uniref:putative lipid II flippase FtsW n=1 Tax=Alkalicoccus chagannorensis TaxID=427072 RepID=UPI0004009899|nr:putative lipid II flippase FtsW [Alkalicoccus chagannorensis]